MRHFIRRLVQAVFVSLALGNLSAQELTPTIPPLPDVAALAKASLSNINYSTGLPSIQIPIHTLTEKSLEVSVGLSYNASGIKVEDEATVAGLGWTLQHGGMISRVIKGLPDDLGTGGFIHTDRTVQWLLSNYEDVNSNFAVDDAVEGYLDLEPDNFTVSIPGYSTSLFYDQGSDQFIQKPNVGLVIESVFVDGRIDKWIITAPNGVKYYLGISKDLLRTARERIISEKTTIRDTNSGIVDISGRANDATSCWYLMDIYDPNTDAEVSFFYSYFHQTVCRRTSESQDFEEPGDMGCGSQNMGLKTNFLRMTSRTFRVDSIKSRN